MMANEAINKRGKMEPCGDCMKHHEWSEDRKVREKGETLLVQIIGHKDHCEVHSFGGTGPHVSVDLQVCNPCHSLIFVFKLFELYSWRYLYLYPYYNKKTNINTKISNCALYSLCLHTNVCVMTVTIVQSFSKSTWKKQGLRVVLVSKLCFPLLTYI